MPVLPSMGSLEIFGHFWGFAPNIQILEGLFWALFSRKFQGKWDSQGMRLAFGIRFGGPLWGAFGTKTLAFGE